MEDYRKALLDPAAHFDSPASITADGRLEREQKIELLRRWCHDAHELQVADGEGMSGGERDWYREAVAALRSLGVDYDPLRPD